MSKILIFLGLSLIINGLGQTIVRADTQKSPNYELREGHIGPGGSFQSSSSNFNSQATAGDLGVGDSSSGNYRSKAGFNTTNDPRLVLIINNSAINFGALSTTTPATATSSFSVLNYTSHGYSVFTNGLPPSNGTHVMNGMASTAASQIGLEQYGINLKANTLPVNQGADPVQIPTSNFSFGDAASGYNQANNYRYVNGEEIAAATKSSGQTNYTISYIVNTSSSTPAGQYSGVQNLIVVGSY